MYSKIFSKTGPRQAWSAFTRTFKRAMLFTLMLTGVASALQAQETEYTKPSWWFGVSGAPNFNIYTGSTQQLTADLTAPVAFHQGTGIGLFLAPHFEFHRPGSVLGVILQGGYDSRRGSFEQEMSPCNCPRDLTTKLNYVTVEPSIRIAPFRSAFYLFVGPRFGYNIKKSFVYKQGTNPDYPEQLPILDITGDLSNVNSLIVSGQVGMGYDIELSSQKRRTQWMLSPFVSYQPNFGQAPRTIETWNLSTIRAGLTLKFGRGREIKEDDLSGPVDDVTPIPEPVVVEIVEPEVMFSVNAPRNIPVQRKVREVFPLRNYVFFDLGSSEIPNRYVLLQKDQVKDFKEDQVELFTPKNLSGRSDRQMVVYYNILNILGDRMGENPGTSITLVGSSANGKADAKAMAESIKKYLVNIFGISAARITTDGRDEPKLPSEKPGSTSELVLLREGDRRVSIESSSPVLLMEFQSGPTAPLKPVEVVVVEEAPLDSYVSINTDGSNEAYSSWSLEFKDESGGVTNFGPYSREDVTIPGKSILGTRSEGDYVVTMTGTTKSGKTVKKYANVNMVLWTPPVSQEAMRFSVIYEFDEAKAIMIYEKYLTEVVVPKIPAGGTVIINGYTDIIGDDAYNHQLAHDRAMDVKTILQNGLTKAGRSDVKFEVHGIGEDPALSPFENKYPEERFYNRTVLIDIIPAK